MAVPWQILGSVATPEGKLELRQRGEAEFLIVIGGRILMTSAARRSEEALATLACTGLAGPAPRVLIGGLGMAYTLRAALDVLPPGAQVVVAELTPEVVTWCQGPLAALTAGAAADRRVTIEVADVARLIAQARAGAYHAIVLDLYEGPHGATQRPNDPFYGPYALARTHAALAEGGRLAIWAEDKDDAFEQRFKTAGFDVDLHRAGRGGRSHVVYLGRKQVVERRSPPPSKQGPPRSRGAAIASNRPDAGQKKRAAPKSRPGSQ